MDVSAILNTSLGSFTVGHILSAILTLLVCLVVVRLVMKLVERLAGRAQRINERLRKIILTSAKVVLYALTGIITALLAQGLSAYDAARAGAYLHARAGLRAEKKFGAASMTAWDISECVRLEGCGID